jgi:cytoskeleton protein RodZ
MSLTLGEKLRQAREARGSTISEVAEQTRISAQYLEAIENNDYRTLPGGIFNKGFVKSFAKYVGVDEQEALQDYARLMSDQGEENIDDPKTYRPEVLTDDQARSSLLPTIIFAVIILGLLTWGVLALVNYYQNTQEQPLAANANANKTANSSAANTNSNAAVNPTATPPIATNEIKLEFKTSETVSVEATVDGRRASKEIKPDAPETYTAQQSLRLQYYRGFADRVQLVLNGKPIAAPPAAPNRNSVSFEINKDNIAQILQSGQITAAAPNANVSNAAPR